MRTYRDARRNIVLLMLLASTQSLADWEESADFPPAPNLPDDYELAVEIEQGRGFSGSPFTPGVILQYGEPNLECKVRQLLVYWDDSKNDFTGESLDIVAPSVTVHTIGGGPSIPGTVPTTGGTLAATAMVHGPYVLEPEGGMGPKVPAGGIYSGQVIIDYEAFWKAYRSHGTVAVQSSIWSAVRMVPWWFV